MIKTVMVKKDLEKLGLRIQCSAWSAEFCERASIYYSDRLSNLRRLST